MKEQITKRYIQTRIDNFLKQEEKSLDKIFNQLSLFIYSLESSDSDLYLLAKILPHGYLKQLISYYDGDILKLPSEEKFKKCQLLAACFFLKERGWEWERIKDYLNFPLKEEEFSFISIGKRINTIKKELNKKLLRLIENVEIEEMNKLLEESSLCQMKM